MSAYYNEFDPFAAQWLRNLIAAGHIAPGEVDERSIVSVRPDDLVGFSQCHFFAGIGGWSLALRLAGWPDDRPVWTGSCPCQPFSVAGKGLGREDERHLWPEWFRLIASISPTILFGEQVVGAVRSGWLDEVCRDLDNAGYSHRTVVFPAEMVGAPHRRERLWFVAYTVRDQQSREKSCGWEAGRVGRLKQPVPWHEPWESALSRFRVVDDGISRSVAATDAARNAIVPQAAQAFIEAVMECQP